MMHTPAPSQGSTQANATSSNLGRLALLAVLFLIPCFWQSRIQAGDLASHAYNAWLASRISEGLLPGLWIAHQSNNVLFDIMLVFFSSHFGMAVAQRIAVSIAVLIFAYGTISFCSAGRSSSPWFVVPIVAIFTYGYTFQVGFFNFQIAMGLSLWYLAIFLRTRWPLRLLSFPLLVIAWLAHPLPVVWALGLATYIAVSEHLAFRQRLALLASAFLALAVIHFILAALYKTVWGFGQIFFITGASQALLYNNKYVLPFALLLWVWVLLLRRLIKMRTWQSLISDIYVQLWLLTAAAVALMPSSILFPQFARPFSYITTRLSLASAILLCALLSQVEIRNVEKIVIVSTAVLFFVFVFRDDQKYNRMEDHVDAAVQTFPTGSRVVGLFLTNSTHGNPYWHILDRACIGHCFSYGNYEPCSLQFRVRATRGNRYVLCDYDDVTAVELGNYIVQARDLPLYFVYSCGPVHDRVCSRELHAGDHTGLASREP